MEFCIISPTAGLNRYSTLSKTHLVLPFVEDQEYWRFYTKRRDAGDRIILDNGAYESKRPVDDTVIISLIESPLRPQVVVLPDYLLQPWEKTWHAAIAFLDRWAEKFPDVEWMYVPQAEERDMSGWRTSLLKGVDEPRVSWIGLPRAYATHIACRPLARVEEVATITGYHKKKVHCLGMLAGDVHELHYLDKAGCISIDSSAPVWRGWNGYSLKSFEDSIWPDYPMDFNAEPHQDLVKRGHREDVILKNLEACGIDTSSAR